MKVIQMEKADLSPKTLLYQVLEDLENIDTVVVITKGKVSTDEFGETAYSLNMAHSQANMELLALMRDFLSWRLHEKFQKDQIS